MSRSIADTAVLNRALRLAFAVTAALSIEVMRGSALPMMAPIIALQLLAASSEPPGKKLVVILRYIHNVYWGML